MTDFVPEHTRELGFRIDVYQQTAIHIDVAATRGECVDGFIVDHEELEFFVGQIARKRDARADDLYVFLSGLIVIQAKRLDDFLVILLGGLFLAFPRTEHHVLAARGGVASTSGGEHTGRCDQKWN